MGRRKKTEYFYNKGIQRWMAYIKVVIIKDIARDILSKF